MNQVKGAEVDPVKEAEARKIKELRMVEIEQNDPRLVIEVAEVPKPGVFPDILHYNSGFGSEKADQYPPEIKKFGVAHYRIPRAYGQRLLAATSGRQYKLIYPEELVIRVSNGRMGTEFKRVVACTCHQDSKGNVMFEPLKDHEITKMKKERRGKKQEVAGTTNED